jgi:hypothetical protein
MDMVITKQEKENVLDPGTWNYGWWRGLDYKRMNVTNKKSWYGIWGYVLQTKSLKFQGGLESEQ